MALTFLEYYYIFYINSLEVLNELVMILIFGQKPEADKLIKVDRFKITGDILIIFFLHQSHEH